MNTKNIPNNLEAEQSVLGSMIISKYALQKAVDILTKDSFYSSANGDLFVVLSEMLDKKIPVDLTTLTTELKNKNKINEIGGVERLAEIMDFVPTAANVDYYIKLVEEAALLRRLIDVSTAITTSAYNSDNDVNTTLDSAEMKILSVVNNRRSTEFKTIKEVLNQAEANLEKLSKTKGDITGVATGSSSLAPLSTSFFFIVSNCASVQLWVRRIRPTIILAEPQQIASALSFSSLR